MNPLIALAVSACVVLGAAEARAQVPIRLTIADAILRGIEASHVLAEVEARRLAAEATTEARRVADRPVVSLQAGYTGTNHVDEFAVPDPSAGGQLINLYADVPNNLSTRLDLYWPIYQGGRPDALERAARAQADAIGFDRSAARADLKLEITRADRSVVTADASVLVLEQALVRMDAHLLDARNSLRAGLIPSTDVLSTEAQQSRQRMLLIEARNLREVARIDLRRLVGLPGDAPIDLDATLTPPVVPQTAPMELTSQARVDRPERRALEFRLRAADYLVGAAGAGRRPSLAITGGYDYARPNPQIFPRAPEWGRSWDLGVNLNWSLWDGGRVVAEVDQAAANSQALAAGLREFDARLESDIRQQRLHLESALAAIGAADDAVRSATEARRVTADRYDAGLATNTEVLDAQLALLQAELDRTRAMANARLAAARLDRVLGR